MTSSVQANVAPTTRLNPATLQSRVAPASSKAQVLGGLKQIQRHQLQTLEKVDQSIRKILSETQAISLRAGDQIATEKHLQSIPQRLSALQAQREELLLRRDFMDQIVFHVDTKWSTQPLATFLEQQLLDMATNELTSASSTKTEFWRFYIYLSVAIREVFEPREDLVEFLAGYIEFSGINKPKSPVAYLDSRNYTAGPMSQAARPGRKDEVGNIIERKMRALGVTEDPKSTSSATTSPVETSKSAGAPKGQN